MVYIINGHPNSGKDYFAHKCVEMMGDENAKIFSKKFMRIFTKRIKNKL